MELSAYGQYQDTESQFYPSIPTSWELKKMKFMVNIQNGRDHKAVESYEGYDVIGSGGAFSKATSYLYDGESVLLGRKGTIDQPLYVNERFWTVDTMYYTIINSDVYPKFFYYSAKSIPFQYLTTQTTLPSMTQFDLGNFFLATPDYEEQQKIATFLDYKTQQIDQLIAKKKALIEKLEEQRIAVITQAVTKGLDKDVKLVPSGVDWLGDMPDGWAIFRLKFVVQRIIDTEHKTAEYFSDGEYLVARTTNVRNGKLILEGGKYTDKKTYDQWTKRAVPQEGDILFTREAPAGEACIIPKDITLCIGQRMVLFKLNSSEVNSVFLLNSLYAGLADEFIKKLSLGSTVAHFNMADIQNIPLFLPTVKEQDEIAIHLEYETQRIDASIDLNENAIDKLQEYRSALITAAVTGKIDVRDWQAPTEIKQVAEIC